MTYFSYGQVLKMNYNNLYQKPIRYTPPLSLISSTQKSKWVIPYQMIQVWTWPISEFDKNLPNCYNIYDKIIQKTSA